MFLRDVDLRVSLDATQHGKAENRNYRFNRMRFQAFSMRVRTFTVALFEHV